MGAHIIAENIAKKEKYFFWHVEKKKNMACCLLQCM